MWQAIVLFVVGAGALAGQPAPIEAAVHTSLCASRAGCRVVSIDHAGADAAGDSLWVAALALPGSNDYGACRPYAQEYWLLSASGEPQLVLSLCNDGYGASGVGEDRVAVGANRIVHAQHGGSSWRWTIEQTIQLRPLRVVRERLDGYWALRPDQYEQAEWDWLTLTGRTDWWAPRCDDEAAIEQVPVDHYAFLPLPALAPQMVNGDSAAVTLGTCALELAGNAFTIEGDSAAGFAEGEWLRVALIGTEQLIFSVRQTHWNLGASDRLADDHVRLWLGQAANYFSCVETPQAPQSWAVMPSDGAVIPIGAAPDDAPRVIARHTTEERDATIVTLRIVLPQPVSGITLGFSRSRDGRSWIGATSGLDRTDVATLGRARPVGVTEAVCAVRDGRLELLDSGLPQTIHGLR